MLYSMMFLLVASGLVARAPGLMGAGIAFDLTVSAAFATWWLGARRGRLHRRAPFVVLALGFIAARLLLPADARAGMMAMRLGWAAVELVAMGLIVAQTRTIRRRFRVSRLAGAPPIDALADALTPVVGELVARLFAFELGTIGLALGGWRRPTPREDDHTFSMHRRAHFSLLVGVFVFLVVGETAALHVLLARWSTTIAWLSTLSSLWLTLWLIGHAQATRLQPLRLRADGLEVAVGIRWRAFVPWRAVQSISAAAGEPRAPGTLRATVGAVADVRLVLKETLEARGLLGRVRRFDTLLLTVDRAEELIARVRDRLA
jgi:hypothetical protein